MNEKEQKVEPAVDVATQEEIFIVSKFEIIATLNLLVQVRKWIKDSEQYATKNATIRLVGKEIEDRFNELEASIRKHNQVEKKEAKDETSSNVG